MQDGADTQNRTGDLVLTKDALYRLSYISIVILLERAAGIEPASSAWKAEVIAIIRCPRPSRSYSPDEDGGGGRIRTFEGSAGRFTV